MWHAIFVPQISVLEKIVRTVLVYATIAVLFRITGKRQLANLDTLDFVVVFLLSNIVQNAVIGNDLSYTGGAIGAVTLISVNQVLNQLAAHSPRARRILEGEPTVIIEDGRILPGASRRLALTRDELEHAIRVQNGDSIAEVHRGVLAPGGQLIVTLNAADETADKTDVSRILDRLEQIERRVGGGGASGNRPAS
jgi:uncharacterized membrane protein YcaP (DUF421 family)